MKEDKEVKERERERETSKLGKKLSQEALSTNNENAVMVQKWSKCSQEEEENTLKPKTGIIYLKIRDNAR